MEHAETIVEKAVAFVKDVLGVHSEEPDVVARPEYSDSETQIDTKDEMLLNPKGYPMKSIGELSSEAPLAPESGGEFEGDTDETDELRVGAPKGGAPIDPEDAMLLSFRSD
jgi:hypothetical protein